MSKSNQPTVRIALVGMTGVGKSTLVNVLSGGKKAEATNNATPCTAEPKEYKVEDDKTTYCIWDTRGLNEASEWSAKFIRLIALAGWVPVAERQSRKLLYGSNPKIDLVLFCIEAGKIGVKSHWKIYNEICSNSCKGERKVAVVVMQIRERELGSEWKTKCKEKATRGGVTEFPDESLVEAMPELESLEKFDDPRAMKCRSNILKFISKACGKEEPSKSGPSITNK